MTTGKHLLISLAVFAGFGALYLAAKPRSAAPPDKPGYEDLVPCAFLTSIDSKRSLYLSGDHTARLSDSSGTGTNWSAGHWDLVDDDDHVYKITIDGETTTYTLVSAPEGEGCMLAAGTTTAADLEKSWFSVLTDPK